MNDPLGLDPLSPTPPTLRELIADALAYNDACGPGPVSQGEYLADADALIALAAKHRAERRKSTDEELVKRVAWMMGVRCGCHDGKVEEGPAGATWTVPCGRCEGTKLPLRDAREIIAAVRAVDA